MSHQPCTPYTIIIIIIIIIITIPPLSIDLPSMET